MPGTRSQHTIPRLILASVRLMPIVIKTNLSRLFRSQIKNGFIVSENTYSVVVVDCSLSFKGRTCYCIYFTF